MERGSSIGELIAYLDAAVPAHFSFEEPPDTERVLVAADDVRAVKLRKHVLVHAEDVLAMVEWLDSVDAPMSDAVRCMRGLLGKALAPPNG